MVRAHAPWRFLSSYDGVEHSAKPWAIDHIRLYPESNKPPCELIHDDEDPMASKPDGLAAEQIDAPQTIFCLTNEGKPGGSTIPLWAKVRDENSPYHVVIEREGKGFGYLFRNFGAPKVGIPPFHLQYQFNEFLGRALRAGLLSVRGRRQPSIFPLHYGLMKFQKRRRLNENGHPLDAARIQKGGPQAKEETIE